MGSLTRPFSVDIPMLSGERVGPVRSPEPGLQVGLVHMPDLFKV